ncbi:hypothetical protein GCK72_008519 [Caenorhabditis remanei]|uniref:Uncharacterized protein n=1 Tax=Caenorhabditis remanei TaxID=31234 RepID=A0A6A5H0V8_CAERE|nr:hypothetical protein GCK72_008519 [Caenorhabditis remanei]KAF1760273.1 hypothetical protein GCK72_008519 [Caenorhabditis remanei]
MEFAQKIRKNSLKMLGVVGFFIYAKENARLFDSVNPRYAQQLLEIEMFTFCSLDIVDEKAAKATEMFLGQLYNDQKWRWSVCRCRMRWLGSLWKDPGGILQKRLDHNFDRPAAATSTNTRHSDLVRVMATLSLSGLSMKSGSAVAAPSGALFLSPALSDEWKDLERENLEDGADWFLDGFEGLLEILSTNELEADGLHSAKVGVCVEDYLGDGCLVIAVRALKKFVKLTRPNDWEVKGRSVLRIDVVVVCGGDHADDGGGIGDL